MNTTKRRTTLIAICSLLLAFSAFFGIRLLTQADKVVYSSPSFSEENIALGALETISDESTPLAAPQYDQSTVELLDVVSEERAITAGSGKADTAASELDTQAPAAQEPETPVEPEAPVDPETPQEPETPEEPETPVVISTAASRLLERANTLLTQFYACATTAEKRALLDATNNSLGNDAMRAKLLADLGGSWEKLETEVVEATEYQQGKTLYVQVYMSGLASNFVPVVYTTQNSDRSNNQWATNLVFDDETGTWMEYTKKHPYNDSREVFYVTTLAGAADTYEVLKDTMETSDVWQEVIVPEETADEAAAPLEDAAPLESESTIAPEPAAEG